MADVRLTITGEDKTAPARQGLIDTEKAIGMVKNAAAALGVSLSAMALVNYAKDATLAAARYETLGVTMNVVGNNAGYTSEQMGGFQKSLEKTGIAMIEARQNLTTMAQAHIELASASKLARIAQDAAVIGGINSSEAFSRMIVGIQSGQVEILRTIGINVNFENSYKKLGIQLGKSAEDLTEMEKAQARTNAVLEKGKDIAGAYEAAMGTAGKQIQSLKRYSDNLKVTLGEVFQDALIMGVVKFTDGLKEANTESEKLQQEGKLKEWGKDVVMAFAFVADMVDGVIKVVGTFTGTTIAGMMQIYDLGKAALALARGDLAGSKQALAEMAAVGEAWSNDMKKRWSDKSFQQSAADMYAAREANAAKDKAMASDLEKQRLAGAAAAKKEQEAKDAAAKTEKDFLNNLKNSLSGITDYANALADLGKERLKFADERYNDQLKKEVELYSQGKAALADLITPLKRYNVEVNDVFNQRLAIERSALGKIANLYAEFKQKVSLSANTKEVQQHGVDIVKAYKDAAEKIISIEQTRYTTLYEGERRTFEQFKSLNDAKKQEIKALQVSIEEANKAYEASRRAATGDYSGGFGYLDTSLDELGKRQAMIDKLRADEATASAIQDPARQKDKLLQVAEGWMQLTGKVELAGQTVITTEQAWQTAMSERDRIQKLVFGTLESQQREAAARQDQASAEMDQYRQKLIDLDDILKNMTRTITIDLKVNGMEAIQQIQGLAGQAAASPFSSSSRSGMSASDYYQQGDSFYWGDGSYAGPAYAKGTDYVPRTGIALVHQGEKITPAGHNSGVTIGTISITLQSTGNAQTDADQLARALVPAITKQMGRSLAA